MPATLPNTSAPAGAPSGPRLAVRSILLGERIDTAGLETSTVIATNPVAFRSGAVGYAVLLRYGAVVMFGLTPVEEDELLRGLGPRVIGPHERAEQESAVIEIAPDKEEQVAPGGPIVVRDLSPQRLLVLADVFAKNVVLSNDERRVAAVFEAIEPVAAELARSGRSRTNRRQMLRTIGQALLVHHRMSGRVEVEEKPDVLWDHPQFERLYARLADEYELKERAVALSRKLEVIGETAQALTDILDTERSVRLEATIVLLIVFEILITFYEMFMRVPK